jgi:N-methylhydantoinase B
MFRGGLTSAVAVVPHKTDGLTWKSQNTAGADQSNAAGIHGGYPGAGSIVSVVRGSRVRSAFENGDIPIGYDQLGGTVEHLPTKSEGRLGDDDALVFFAPGGGGYGDPLDREPRRVVADVLAGAVSNDGALHQYGVVVTDDGQLDQAATTERRGAIRAARLGLDGSATVAGRPADRPSGRPVGPYLEFMPSDDGEIVICGRCGTTVGSRRTDAKDGELGATRVEQRPLKEAGPWLALRYGGDSPNFILEKRSCPGCGTLLDVSERRRMA